MPLPAPAVLGATPGGSGCDTVVPGAGRGCPARSRQTAGGVDGGVPGFTILVSVGRFETPPEVEPAGVVTGGVTGGFGGVTGGFAGPFIPFIIALPARPTYGAATLAAAARPAPTNGKASSTLVFEVAVSTASIRRRISLILISLACSFLFALVSATKQ